MEKQKRSLGIKKAVIITVAILTSFMLSLVSAIGFWISYQEVKEHIQESTKHALETRAESVGGWLKGQGEFVTVQASAVGKVNEYTEGHEKNDDYIDNAVTMDEALLDCYTTYEDASIYMAVTDTSTLPEGFDPTTRMWYQQAKSEGQVIYTSPYMDVATGEMVITAAAPIKEKGEFAGVFGCDITIKKLMEMAGGLQITKNGYPVLIDSDGNFMVHKNEAFVPSASDGNVSLTSYQDIKGEYSKALSDLGNEVKIGLYKDYDGKEKYFAFTKLADTNWSIGFIMPKGDIDGEINHLATAFLIMFIIFFVAGNLIVLVVINFEMRPLKKISEAAAQIAAGDLSAEFHYSSRDEVGRLCEGFKQCVDMMRKYVGDIYRVLEGISRGDLTVSTNVEYEGDFLNIKTAIDDILFSLNRMIADINSGSSEVYLGSNQMADGSQALADGATKEAAALEEISAAITEASEQIAQTADNALKVGQLRSRHRPVRYFWGSQSSCRSMWQDSG